MPNVDDFFSLLNKVGTLSKEDKKQAVNYIEPIDAFARTTYKSLYVIDYKKKGFDYVSNNPLFLCGNTPEEVKKMGYEFYFKHVIKEDLALLLKINTRGFEFYERVPMEERKNYSISYDFHLIDKKGKKTLINHEMTPLFMTKEGKLWKAMAVVSLSSENKSGNIKVTNKKENTIYYYNLKGDFWEKKHFVKLSTREKEILKYSIRGCTLSDIADAMSISDHTVKFHKRKLLDKLEVTNISEAIAYVTNNKLI